MFRNNLSARFKSVQAKGKGASDKLKEENRFFKRVFAAIGILVCVGATCLAK
jgi:hypothetical protein